MRLVIGKLLTKAESTSSPAEAEALLVKAQHLATRHAIDLGRARLEAAGAVREIVEERTVTIGRPRQPHLVVLRRLYVAVAEVNDVTVLLRGTEAVLHPIGVASDLDTTHALYLSLAAQLRQATEAWLVSDERPAGLHTTSARNFFGHGFVNRITGRLRQARDEAIAQALAEERERDEAQAASGPGEAGVHPGRSTASSSKAQPSTALSSTSLVLQSKADEVAGFIAANYGRVGTRSTRAGRSQAGAGSAMRAGGRAADRAHLRASRPITG